MTSDAHVVESRHLLVASLDPDIGGTVDYQLTRHVESIVSVTQTTTNYSTIPSVDSWDCTELVDSAKSKSYMLCQVSPGPTGELGL